MTRLFLSAAGRPRPRRATPRDAAARRAPCLAVCVVTLLLALGGGWHPARAQEGGAGTAAEGWATHTSMREVRAVAASDEALWAATTGGVFGYRPASGEYEQLTVAGGLYDVQAQAITYDPAGDALWVGYQDGALDRVDIETGRVEHFLDVTRADQFSSRGINRLEMRGDSLLVSTAFGLVVFDAARGEVRDTYSKLGVFGAGTAVYDATVAPGADGLLRLWLATEAGLAHAPLASTNLQDPSAWTTEVVGGDLPLRSVAAFGGSLYMGTTGSLWVRRSDGTKELLLNTGRPVGTLRATDEQLLGIYEFGVIAVEASGIARVVRAGLLALVDLAIGPDGRLWLGNGQDGLMMLEAGGTYAVVQQDVFPAGPADSLFPDLHAGPDGALWAAGPGGTAKGFYRLGTDGVWTNFTGRHYEALQGRSSFNRIHADPGGGAWAGSEGHGLAQVTPEGTVVTYDDDNSTLLGAVPGYFIVNGVATEADGTLWVSNPLTTRPLHVRTPEGDWTAFGALTGDGLAASMNAYEQIFIDSFGQKWIIVLDERDRARRRRGLVVLDTGGTPTDDGDDAINFFGEEGSAGQGLPSTFVTTVVEDRDGLIWIGTNEGLAYMLNTGIVARDGSATPIWPQWADRSQGTFVLAGLPVNDIAVDPANRLWVATSEGVYLLAQQQAGMERVLHFTAENSPLLSNMVNAVAVDGRSGRVFFATDRGMISYQGDARSAVEHRQELLVYPNPARPGTGSDACEIHIEGLVEETEIVILTASGEVVRRLPARGGSRCWDARDAGAQPVPSGVYLVVAVGQNGEGTAYGKVAVIR